MQVNTAERGILYSISNADPMPPHSVLISSSHLSYPPGSPAMYSSHRIDRVTCLRLSSRCTAAQSGSACRRWPRRVPEPAPAPANSRGSSSVSVMWSGIEGANGGRDRYAMLPPCLLEILRAY